MFGLDSTKEMKYRVGLPAWLAKRGVSSLIVDQPGTGEALRLHGQKEIEGGDKEEHMQIMRESIVVLAKPI